MKQLHFLISFLTVINFFNSPLALAQTQINDDQGDPRAFEVYLTYINPMMTNNYNIETPWIIQGPKESEEAVLQRVEAQLRTRFSNESNFSNLPSWIASEAMIFQRQVVCDREKTELSGAYRQTVRNSSDEQSENQSASRSASVYDNREKNTLNGVGSEAKSFFQKQSESDSSYDSYKLNGYTVIKTEEKIYTTSCVKKHYEFKGKLLAERVLSISQIDKNLKLYLIRKSLDKVYNNFVTRYKYLSGLIQYVLTSPNLTSADVSKLGYANSSDLVANIKTELSSLISTYAYFSSTSTLFKNYHYTYFSESLEGVANDIKMKLTSIKSFLENYEPNMITFGVLSENQLQSLYLFSQEELVGLFSPIGTFNFQSRLKNPLQQTKTYYENKSKEVSQCQTTFDSLVKLTKQSAQFSQELATFRDNDINLIKGCSNSLNMILHYSALLKYVQTYKCILSDSTCLYGRCIANLQCQ
ncbi:MAG: hypothetical protein JNL11_10485 [Bdellovibrionaceae bacterium]|nr:hypothetical protein [Pseudobdellovibrionaceae bacterium]